MIFLYKKIHFVQIFFIFFNLYSNSTQLNFKWPESHIQLTPCHSTYTISSGNYVLDYDSKVTGNYHNDCTFLIEGSPGTQLQLNATITILNETNQDECMHWIKFYDFYSNTTLVPLGEYCKSTNLTNLQTFSNIMFMVINISPADLFQLSIIN
ncbi:uncharacterized protein LOC112603801 [Melanaphis sacchari]|uniref:uncharacterized protein LOC112603801 n=1 Tax=Melanaphis sacchari TaxID=742174 RepID=UPI000DC13410|nr:uncharacterized protein LOC112603801 [Melanaphis sacchari]